MNMTWRWYGRKNDSITLDHIRQIPGVKGIVWSLHDKVAGDIWELDRIKEEVAFIRSKGFHAEVVESVNVHDAIKIGLPTRDKYIDIYIDTIKKLASVGVKVICYNFMPVFDWTRTDLYKPHNDGSTSLFYENNAVLDSPRKMVDKIIKGAGSFNMPGWEPERLEKLEDLIQSYEGVTNEVLRENLKYFLDKIIPVCEELDIKMAIHPDDPPWSIFGLPRIVKSMEHIQDILELNDSKYNGLTLCTGSLGANLQNNIPNIIDKFHDRIHFSHVRNVKVFENGDFMETSHRSQDGDVDVCEILRTYHKNNFEGYIRPDHGRHLWGEESVVRPGYGLYDRALGVMYILGVWDVLERINKK